MSVSSVGCNIICELKNSNFHIINSIGIMVFSNLFVYKVTVCMHIHP